MSTEPHTQRQKRLGIITASVLLKYVSIFINTIIIHIHEAPSKVSEHERVM